MRVHQYDAEKSGIPLRSIQALS